MTVMEARPFSNVTSLLDVPNMGPEITAGKDCYPQKPLI